MTKAPQIKVSKKISKKVARELYNNDRKPYTTNGSRELYSDNTRKLYCPMHSVNCDPDYFSSYMNGTDVGQTAAEQKWTMIKTVREIQNEITERGTEADAFLDGFDEAYCEEMGYEDGKEKTPQKILSDVAVIMANLRDDLACILIDLKSKL